MSRSVLEELLNLIHSDENPNDIRKKVVAWICKKTGAKWGFMVIQSETHRHGHVRPSVYKDTIDRFNQSSDWKMQNDEVSFYKIRFGKRIVGTLALKQHKSNALNFQSVLKLISLFEQRRILEELLAVSQNTLRNLSDQSALIAQNHDHLFEELGASMRRLQAMSRGVIRMQEAERAKISRELHDGIGQALTALKMNLDFVIENSGNEIRPASRQNLEEARTTAEQSLSDVRELSRLLRPRMLDDLGLLPTLNWAARSFSKRTGIEVKLMSDKPDVRLDAEVETMIFRITQEALNNIAKHSKAKTATVQLGHSMRRIWLVIQDDGVGFDMLQNQKIRSDDFGSGLSGIRDRLALWGGKLLMQSKPGSGTTLRIEFSSHYLMKRVGREFLMSKAHG
jgi:two-component system, NarL family, sensor kinase